MYKAKKKYGQNFLIDNNTIDKIIDSVSINSNDKIIEIGPGKGYLTRELINFNVDLYSFEIDKDMTNYLDKYIGDKTNIIYDDFLNINLNNYFNPNDNIHVIANIPYYITTPIIEHIIESKLNTFPMLHGAVSSVFRLISVRPFALSIITASTMYGFRVSLAGILFLYIF